MIEVRVASLAIASYHDGRDFDFYDEGELEPSPDLVDANFFPEILDQELLECSAGEFLGQLSVNEQASFNLTRKDILKLVTTGVSRPATELNEWMKKVQADGYKLGFYNEDDPLVFAYKGIDL